MSRFLAILGLVITFAYVVFVYWLVGDPVEELRSAPLNNVGDFLAGVFGPVAIFWLILGFFQQGIELRQNNEALKLQADELKNSVEQQRELVDVTRKQVSAELEALQHSRHEAWRALQPNFVVTGGGGSHSEENHTLNLTVMNMGAPVTDVSMRFSGPFSAFSRPSQVMDKSAHVTLKVAFSGTGQGLIDELSIVYMDAANNPGVFVYGVEVDTSGEHPRLKASKLAV